MSDPKWKEKSQWLSKVAPKMVLYYELALKLNQKTQIYEVQIANHFSSLDGFVSPDIGFAN
jgi:hypothetical protein